VSQVFVNYRRDDAAGFAGRLHADLARRLGESRVFRDVTIPPGVDYIDHINQLLSACRVLVAVIGPRWLNAADREGRRRLEKPDDLVRLEIEAALRRPDVEVIPVLVDGALMPDAAELPASLTHLARRNAHEMTDRRWDYDLGVLVERLERALGPPAGQEARQPARWNVALLEAIACAALAGLVARAVYDPPDFPGRDAPLGERILHGVVDHGPLWALVGAAVVTWLAVRRHVPRAPIPAALLGLAAGAVGGAAGGAVLRGLYDDLELELWQARGGAFVITGGLLGFALAGGRGGVSRFEAALAGVVGGLLATALRQLTTPEPGAAPVPTTMGQAVVIVGCIAAVVLASAREPAHDLGGAPPAVPARSGPAAR
jgi:hypothetical protein